MQAVPAKINDKGIIVQDFRFDKESGQLQQNDPPKPIGRVIALKIQISLISNLTFGESLLRLNFKTKNRKTGELVPFERELGIPFITFVTYLFIPLSVGMFPHLFQHWLTAKSAKSFRLIVIAHPLCIMVVWVPCVLVGAWASGVLPAGIPPPAVLSQCLIF